MAKGSDEIHGFLGKGTEFQGQLKFEGTVRIDGGFSGEIKTKGTLLVGEGARVEAEIWCGTLIVNGEIFGDIQAANRVEAVAPAKIHGNIITPVLVINEGVFFDGNAKMESPEETDMEQDKKIPFLGKREKEDKEQHALPVKGSESKDQ